jgi:3'(2'), 5'-bisphosphate nucleotidase
MSDSLVIDSHFTDRLIRVARAAGESILEIYNQPEAARVHTKSDDSPLTAADLAAHSLIVRELPGLLDVPVISEESVLPSLAERRNWSPYWLVDPLDGTKEFIARNGEFTVNIALVIEGEPLLGVVHVPVSDETYLGLSAGLAAGGQSRAEKFHAGEFVRVIHTRSLDERMAQQLPFEVLASKRHGSPEQVQLLEQLQARWPAPVASVSAGSSLKFCLIAEGRADFYPRLAPTCEWDTAAAQAVLCAAGGTVVDAQFRKPLRCNRNDNLYNPWFLALGDVNFDWSRLLDQSV